VNKFIVIKSNIKNFEKKIDLKTAKVGARDFHILQSYVRVMCVNTRKQQKWFWGEIITC